MLLDLNSGMQQRVKALFIRLGWRWPEMSISRRIRFASLGLVLGFLPCGLLYGALAAAAASASALGGLFAMAAFALGTIPALLAVGLAGHFAARRWQPAAAKVGAYLMIINSAVLAWFAWRLVA